MERALKYLAGEGDHGGTGGFDWIQQRRGGEQLAANKWRSRVKSRCAEGARRRYHPSVLTQGRFQMFWIP
jgi:hypothetical protein